MLLSGFLFAGVTAIMLIILFVTSIILIVSSIVLICFISKKKDNIREKVIEDKDIKKTRVMSIFSILTSIFSCIGLVILFLPIMSLIKCSNAKKVLLEERFDEANKKIKSALTLLMITNIVTLILVILNLQTGGGMVLLPFTMLMSLKV